MRILEKLLRYCQGKRLAVVGAGISNRPLIKLLLDAHLDVVVFDQREEEAFADFREELAATGLVCSWSCGESYLERLHGFDLIFKSPIMREDLPELVVERTRGAVITTEIEVLMALCPATILGVTGSDGKTTTATLTKLILDSQGKSCWLGGNIGTPLLCELDRMGVEDLVVLELSSFQLMPSSRSPQHSLITNLSPNHLDVHKDFAEYCEAKAQIFRHQDFRDRLILKGSDPILQGFAKAAKGRVGFVETRPFGDQPLWGIDGDRLFYQASPQAERIPLLTRSELRLKGYYNALNVQSAFALSWPFIHDLDAALMAVKSFGGVAHRLQEIRVIHGVHYIESSIDSSPSRSINSLSAFREAGTPVHMIAGGKDKNLDYRELGKAILTSVKALYLCGQNAPLIAAGVQAAHDEAPAEKSLPIAIFDSYEAALQAASQKAQPGEVVLLSPAGTSFDRFKNFEERGEVFQQLVNKL